jgi:hypothetical protein
MAISWPAMERRGSAVTNAQVEAFERSYGHPLPDDYRQFLLDVNGGALDKENCEFARGVVNRLFSLEDTADDSRDLATRANRERVWLPSSDLLFIGQDDFCNTIVIALAGGHRGEVWLMLTGDVARPDDANLRAPWHDRRDMRKLADSFEQFMRSLRPLS